jgi:hypothetical protein
VNGGDEPKSYTAREIVLEFFPATPQRLIPRPSAYSVRFAEHGGRVVQHQGGRELELTPIPSAGREAAQVCCGLCEWSGPRRDFDALRAEVPGSDGRRFRYVIACRDVEACEARRLDDATLERLVQPVD